jgi:predicted ferric reductase
MRYRGLGRGGRLVLWAVFAIVVGAVLGATGPGAIRAFVSAAGTQHDALPWYTTRLLAILAYLAIAGSVIYGLLLSTKILDAIAHRPVTFTLHQDLASIGLGLAGVHAFVLALDRSVPFSLAEVLVPFASPFRPLWVGVGQVTLYLTLVVVASFYVRRRIGQRSWRMLHYLSFAAFVGSTLHGLQSGSDSGAAWAWWMYAVASTLVTFLFVYRVATAISARGRRAAEHPRAGAVTGLGARSIDAPAA